MKQLRGEIDINIFQEEKSTGRMKLVPGAGFEPARRNRHRLSRHAPATNEVAVGAVPARQPRHLLYLRILKNTELFKNFSYCKWGK